jgi:aspartyl-tRNA(Asn)/glutamyl-tRNA(Gln) amidotransferase subunit A
MTADPELCGLEAAALQVAFRERRLSPLEVLDNAFARMDETEPVLNAFVARCDAQARNEARASEARHRAGVPLGPLDGVPVSVKDLIEVAGMPCTYGSRSMLGHVPQTDAPSVLRLRAAGAIVIGKTTTSEFGYKGYTESPVHGVTRNPWDPTRTPGGSSGGAAASVAAGVTPIALGTDGGGSIRSPAALTGLVGIKAQFGRVPVWPASATPTLAHVGPLARSAADARALLEVIAGPDARDHSSLLPNMDSAEVVTGLRVAFSPTLGYARVLPEVAAPVAAAVDALRGLWPSMTMIEAPFPDPAEILAVEFIGGCSARLAKTLAVAPDAIDPPLRTAIETLTARSAADYARVVAERMEHRARLALLFESIDLLLTPTTPAPAWPLGSSVPPGFEDAMVWSYFTYPFNLTGQPAASLPCGFTDGGLPIGLQLIVRQQGDALLCAALAAAERLLSLPKTHLPQPLAGHASRPAG